MVAWRKKIQPSLRQGMSQCILGRLFQMDAFRQAQTVFAYASMPDEVQLDALLKACLSQGKRIGIPEITGPGIMEAAELESMEDLVTGKFGIRSLAPEVLRIIPPEEIDLMIVPGAAFTRGGERPCSSITWPSLRVSGSAWAAVTMTGSCPALTVPAALPASLRDRLCLRFPLRSTTSRSITS